MTARAKESEWARRQRREKERAEHVAEHGPACQICGNVPKRGLDQDHDHRTGRTRGWLCHRCNRALPNWMDIPWLLATALYLDGQREVEAPAKLYAHLKGGGDWNLEWWEE